MKVYEEKERIIIGRSVDEDWFDLIKSFVNTMAKPHGEEQKVSDVTKNIGASVRKKLKECNYIDKEYVLSLIDKPVSLFPEENIEVAVFGVEISEVEGKILTPVKTDNGKLVLIVKEPQRTVISR